VFISVCTNLQANRAVPVFRVRVVNAAALAVVIIVRRLEQHPVIANRWYKMENTGHRLVQLYMVTIFILFAIVWTIGNRPDKRVKISISVLMPARPDGDGVFTLICELRPTCVILSGGGVVKNVSISRRILTDLTDFRLILLSTVSPMCIRSFYPY
jgi:hypothetical protein